jgi:predicted TIM-barrel fold metal-dependent hydrolase
MARIDSDAHVIESERTWEYMTEREARFKPSTVLGPDGLHYWWIDGRTFARDGNVGAEVSAEDREMKDIAGRIKHMDELEVDVQVLFPSLFLRPLTQHPEGEAALCRSYNRWLADIYSQGQGRLHWAAVMPMMNMDEAIKEAEFGKEHGACAAYTRALPENRPLTAPYYNPIYDALSELDMPMCVHASTPSFDWYETFDRETGFAKFKLPVVSSFHQILTEGLMKRFPKLRYGFIEVSSQWVPYALHDLGRRLERRGNALSKDAMKENRLFVACQVDDDIPYVLQYSGEDNIVIGTDYGHNDTATEIEALAKLAVGGQVSSRAVNKILDDNPRALYGL